MTRKHITLIVLSIIGLTAWWGALDGAKMQQFGRLRWPGTLDSYQGYEPGATSTSFYRSAEHGVLDLSPKKTRVLFWGLSPRSVAVSSTNLN